MQLKINKDLRDIIPALSEQEARDLEASIERRGVETPLLVADLDGEPVLVDGFARYAIATKLGADWTSVDFEFTSTPESVRAPMEREAKNAISRARSTREAKILKVMEEELSEDEEAAIDAALPGALREAKLRELKLHRLNHAIARRNLESFDLIAAVWRRNQELYTREAKEARRAGGEAGRATQYNHPRPAQRDTKLGGKRVREQLARDTGISSRTCEKVVLLVRTASGDFIEGYEGLQDAARDLIVQIRDKSSDMSINKAENLLRDLKAAKLAADGTPEEPADEGATHIPEDDAIKAFRRMRESVFSYDPAAVAARVRTKSPDEVERERRAALQEAAWLETYAEALEPSEVPAS